MAENRIDPLNDSPTVEVRKDDIDTVLTLVASSIEDIADSELEALDRLAVSSGWGAWEMTNVE